jgi:hypothetical protein
LRSLSFVFHSFCSKGSSFWLFLSLSFLAINQFPIQTI